MLIHNYLVNDKELDEDYFIDLEKSLMISCYKGMDFHFEGYNQESLHFVIPVFPDYDYMQSMSKVIVNTFISQYKLVERDDLWRLFKKKSFKFYKKKFVFEAMYHSIGKEEFDRMSPTKRMECSIDLIEKYFKENKFPDVSYGGEEEINRKNFELDRRCPEFFRLDYKSFTNEEIKKHREIEEHLKNRRLR